jgi:hypothetical protein
MGKKKYYKAKRFLALKTKDESADSWFETDEINRRRRETKNKIERLEMIKEIAERDLL